jgi:predicted regulator of Ras-like GTPase activity (Roadblock/LC7/MglB family)
VDPDAAMLAELHRLRWRRPDLLGAVLAGLDGMLIASDLPGIDGHHVAALAATSLGIGQRFTQTLRQGTVSEYVIQAASGCIVSYPAGRHALLTVVAGAGTNLDPLHAEARAVADRLGSLFNDYWRPAADPSADLDPDAPLTLRTPMATLPGSARGEFSLRRLPDHS